MTKTIAFPTQKGGAGKTSITGNIAFILSKNNYKVLVVDFDSSQGNMILWMLNKEQQNSLKWEVGDYLNSLNTPRPTKARDLKNVIVKVRENLDLLPTFNVASSLKEYITSKINLPEESQALGTLIKEASELGYNYIFFDLSPAMLSLEKRITFFIDEVIPVTPASTFGVQGIVTNNEEQARLKPVQDQIRKKPLIRNKLILNGYDKRFKKHKDAKKNLESSGIPLFVIRTSSLIDQWQEKGIFISEDSVEHPIITDYINLANAISNN